MDIDIDLQTTFDPTDYFKVTKASMVKKDELKKHPAGAYFQAIPTDPITGLSAIPFKEAEDMGYFKIDFLHLSFLDNFSSKEEIRALLRIEPNWDLLLNEYAVGKLFQLAKHYDLLREIKPRTVQELADCVALIRPLKYNLRYSYRKDTEASRRLLYLREEGDKTSFKRGHAIAYALTIVLQLHFIEAGLV
jgi:hypothetical protein